MSALPAAHFVKLGTILIGRIWLADRPSILFTLAPCFRCCTTACAVAIGWLFGNGTENVFGVFSAETGKAMLGASRVTKRLLQAG